MYTQEQDALYKEAFSRNIGIVSSDQQALLRTCTVAIAGLGGVGGIYATTFARLGIGAFHIADADVIEIKNINRQAVADNSTIGRHKSDVVEALIRLINPSAEVSVFMDGITKNNVHDFLVGVDVVVDGIDFFEIETRRMLFAKAREMGIFVITAGPVGYGSSMLVFDPHGMSFDEYFDINDELTLDEKLIRFGVGLTPSLMQRAYFDPRAINWKTHQAPSLVTGTLLCANLVSTTAVKILFGEPVRTAPRSLHVDPYLFAFKNIWVPFGNKNPIQVLKRIVMTKMLRKEGVI